MLTVLLIPKTKGSVTCTFVFTAGRDSFCIPQPAGRPDPRLATTLQKQRGAIPGTTSVNDKDANVAPGPASVRP